MIVITDANIIFSALQNPESVISTILKDNKKFQFLAPDYLLEEIKRHWEKLEEYSILGKKELKAEWKLLQKNIKFINSTEISRQVLEESFHIVKDIDEYDLYFIALHLHTKHKVWTGDKVLIKGVEAKGYKIFVTTAQLKAKLYKNKKK